MSVSMSRLLSRATIPRSFSTTSLLRTLNQALPVDDSTSALDYKSAQRRRPSPLTVMGGLHSRTLEAVATHISYNTPRPSPEPQKKHVLGCLVQNEPGVLSRVSDVLAARGFNIDSLVVSRTENCNVSRMTIVIDGQDSVVEHARRQLEDLVPVWAVLDYTYARRISRELLLAKVSLLGPEHVEGANREALLAQNFERGVQPEAHVPPPPMAAESVRQNYQHLQSIANQFGAKIVDVSTRSAIVELTAKTDRVVAFLGLLKPLEVLESARTGLVVMPCTPILGSNGIPGEWNDLDEFSLPPT